MKDGDQLYPCFIFQYQFYPEDKTSRKTSLQFS